MRPEVGKRGGVLKHGPDKVKRGGTKWRHDLNDWGRTKTDLQLLAGLQDHSVPPKTLVYSSDSTLVTQTLIVPPPSFYSDAIHRRKTTRVGSHRSSEEKGRLEQLPGPESESRRGPGITESTKAKEGGRAIRRFTHHSTASTLRQRHHSRPRQVSLCLVSGIRTRLGVQL